MSCFHLLLIQASALHHSLNRFQKASYKSLLRLPPSLHNRTAEDRYRLSWMQLQETEPVLRRIYWSYPHTIPAFPDLHHCLLPDWNFHQRIRCRGSIHSHGTIHYPEKDGNRALQFHHYRPLLSVCPHTQPVHPEFSEAVPDQGLLLQTYPYYIPAICRRQRTECRTSLLHRFLHPLSSYRTDPYRSRLSQCKETGLPARLLLHGEGFLSDP